MVAFYFGSLCVFWYHRDHPAPCTVRKVLDEFAEQSEVYARVAEPMIATAVKGKSAAIIMYGQTGSGKTFSMIGPVTTRDPTPMLSRI